MTWATISARKMVLKNRINTLETELIRISQRLQDAYDDAAYDQRKNQLNYDYELAGLTDEYQAGMDGLEGQDLQGQAFQGAYNTVVMQYMDDKRQLDAGFAAQNQMVQDKADAKTKALEAEQEQIETQLEAARAEYESLDKACSEDIKNGAINLGGN